MSRQVSVILVQVRNSTLEVPMNDRINLAHLSRTGLLFQEPGDEGSATQVATATYGLGRLFENLGVGPYLWSLCPEEEGECQFIASHTIETRIEGRESKTLFFRVTESPFPNIIRLIHRRGQRCSLGAIWWKRGAFWIYLREERSGELLVLPASAIAEFKLRPVLPKRDEVVLL